MQKMVWMLERIAPEVLTTVKLRYRILREVLHGQPLGRRQIAQRVGCSERTARSEVETLREKGALEVTFAGICLTAYGRELLEQADEVIPLLEDLDGLALRLKREFALDEAIVVPGDSHRDPYVREDLGRAAARYLRSCLFDGCRVAVTGGTTLAAMAQAMAGKVEARGVLVLPARGGLGGDVEEQANVIAARIAKAIGAEYCLLHVPDSLNAEAIETLRHDANIQQVVELIRSADILVHGIGAALEMAGRRGLDREGLRVLEEKGAVGEALRYYFNAAGEVVYSL
ncbi:MAG: transcriptional regulator, partial [Syntrophomonadaceae bacterium]|nr:transcriptional regulator [Syntrophomonadaceae bacterium]